MNYTAEQIAALADTFFAQGWQLACHVHGDLAVDAVLDAFEGARVRDPRGDRRLRLEHCGAMRPEQFARARALGATVSFFVAHLYHWGDVLIDELFGDRHGAQWMSTRSALDAGVRISMHNDGPVTPADPIGNIATAVTRRTKGTGRVLAPDQRLTVDEALRAQTIDAAWQLFVDERTGSIEVGKSADFVVVSDDPRAVDRDAIRDITVQATYFEGRATFER
jgi:predicted amidohydrolase YtcJ